jgi:hypothetical protein
MSADGPGRAPEVCEGPGSGAELTSTTVPGGGDDGSYQGGVTPDPWLLASSADGSARSGGEAGGCAGVEPRV